MHKASTLDKFDEARWTIAEVGRAIGRPANSIRSDLQRGHVKLYESDKLAEVNGLPHLLSLRSALCLGAMGELIAHFVPPKLAGAAATQWAYFGDAERDPACLYPDPYTYLCVYKGGLHDVLHVPIKTGFAFNMLLPPGGRRQSGMVAIVLDDVDRAVRSGLLAS